MTNALRRRVSALAVNTAALVLLSHAATAQAADASLTPVAGITYEVGPGKPYADLQAVASQLRPGDVVHVYARPTPYPGDLVLRQDGTPTAPITIVGVRANGQRPVLSGGINTIEFQGNHYVFAGFEITQRKLPCVFHHAHAITIRDTVVHDCPGHGILGADSDAGSLTLEYSEVYRTGSGSRRHGIYMATDETVYPGAVFRMQHCYVHDMNGGHAVKSRAERNEIYYNWIEGAYYRELELIGPDGQAPSRAREDSDVVGNVLVHRGTTSTVRIGGDGTGDTSGRYRFAWNTFIHTAGATGLGRHAV
jgi:hypothetical protein